MRVLVFDPFRGAAGDMICGALLDLGADTDQVTRAMRSVVTEPDIHEVKRAGIRALKVDTRAPVISRTLEQVLERVSGADAPEEAVSMAVRVFDRISRAEREIHGDHPHFHEVGADDAIADVIGACTALVTLSVDAVTVRTIALGGGSISGTHGKYPVPAPATLAVLLESGLPVCYGSEADGELCTPTGAALLSEFASCSPDPPFSGSVAATGYGAGERDNPSVPNVLRATLIETGPGVGSDAVDILETNVDDVTGEVLACSMARLMEAGARDVCSIPCTMKKGRPGYLVRVVCSPEYTVALAKVMARETGTLGVRCLQSVHRFVARRDLRMVSVNIQGDEREIPVKFGFFDGKVFSLKAEFDHVQEWADALGIPARVVARCVEDAAWKTLLEGEK